MCMCAFYVSLCIFPPCSSSTCLPPLCTLFLFLHGPAAATNSDVCERTRNTQRPQQETRKIQLYRAEASRRMGESGARTRRMGASRHMRITGDGTIRMGLQSLWGRVQGRGWWLVCRNRVRLKGQEGGGGKGAVNMEAHSGNGSLCRLRQYQH